MRAQRLAVLVSLVLLATIAAPVGARTVPAAGGDYIVVFRDNVASPVALAAQLERAHGFNARFVYEHALKGFAATLPGAAVEALRQNPNVAWVEADGMAYPIETQTNATWGLDRIDQRTDELDGSYTYDTDGSGVTAYVIDSGILYTHNDFDPNPINGYDATGGNGVDCNGHGTHVAGTIGGTRWGVAKDVTLVSVRVFGCSGGSSWSVIIDGVDWVTEHHQAGTPAVANMSLGGGGNSSVDAAVRNSIADGISYAVAAGNGNFIGREDDACKYSPARVTEAMTIGATDRTDTKASWSNYGECVDWFAPGVGITSAWIDNDDDANTISGTSMATPHTAGVAALYLETNPGASAQTVRDTLYAGTTKGIVNDSRTTNNHLLFNLRSEGDGGGTPTTGSIAGTVTASTGGALSATITVTRDGSTVGTTATDPETGNYSMEVPAADDYSVTATSDGYEDQTKSPISVAAGATTDDVDFALTASDTGGGDGSTFGITVAPSSTSQGRNWTAFVTVTAATNEDTPQPVGGVVISGSWTGPGGPSESTCTTDASSGTCQVWMSGIHKSVGSVTFDLDSVSDTTTKAWDRALTLPMTVTVFKP